MDAQEESVEVDDQLDDPFETVLQTRETLAHEAYDQAEIYAAVQLDSRNRQYSSSEMSAFALEK